MLAGWLHFAKINAMSHRFLRFWVIPVCVFLLSSCASISEPPVIYDAHTKVDLISDVTTIKPGEPFWAAVRMRMDKDWHVYWRNPGDSGLAPTIKWQLPDGFSAGPIQWPYPKRIDSRDLTSYGYESEVLLPVEITPPARINAANIELNAQVHWLACEVPCIPGQASLSLPFKVAAQGPAVKSRWQESILTAQRKLPVDAPAAWFTAFENATMIKLVVAPETTLLSTITSAQFFPFADDLIEHGAPQSFMKSADGRSFTLQVLRNKRYAAKPRTVIDGILVAQVDGGQPVIWNVSTAPRVSQPQASSTEKVPAAFGGVADTSLVLMLVFSFIGGMILNLMPCVFPVLSLKVLNVVNHSRSRKMLLQSVIGYSMGVVSSFVALSLVLIALRQAGQSAGWGFQFQSVYFVTGMAVFLFVMALNLFGLFEWAVPGVWIAQKKQRFVVLESVLTGVLATVVATPCTAPFMGTALSFALTQSAFNNILIFMFLGLGMSAPFAVLAFFPKLLKRLPKPGPWMEQFKIFLGFPLLATVVWLLWVLAGQRGPGVVIAVLFGLLGIALGFWLKRVANRHRALRVLGVLVICAGLYLPFAAAGSFQPTKAALQSQDDSLQWVSFEPDLVEKNVKAGKVVFIDFTARWCLTCQVNKKLALENPQVVQSFVKKGVVAFRADWTDNDATITTALAQFGKNSVPFNVFLYSADGRQESKILPEILTPAIVLETLNQIK